MPSLQLTQVRSQMHQTSLENVTKCLFLHFTKILLRSWSSMSTTIKNSHGLIFLLSGRDFIIGKELCSWGLRCCSSLPPQWRLTVTAAAGPNQSRGLLPMSLFSLAMCKGMELLRRWHSWGSTTLSGAMKCVLMGKPVPDGFPVNTQQQQQQRQQQQWQWQQNMLFARPCAGC